MPGFFIWAESSRLTPKAGNEDHFVEIKVEIQFNERGKL